MFYLVDKSLAVLSNLVEDLVGGAFLGWVARLAGYGQRVDQGLGVMFTQVGQKLRKNNF
jgi:hypothetical protein